MRDYNNFMIMKLNMTIMMLKLSINDHDVMKRSDEVEEDQAWGKRGEIEEGQKQGK